MENDDAADGDLLFELNDAFWVEYSALVRKYIEKTPEHLHSDLLEMLQGSSSVYTISNS